MIYPDKFLLTGKVAFITGGVGFLGVEVTKAFAEAKARVVVLDVDEYKGQKLIRELTDKGFKVEFERFDITELTDIEKSIDNLFLKYGRIDVWVNAAYPRTEDWGEKVENLNIKSWQRNVDMLLNSYAWISRKVCLVMKAQKEGSLINFGSIYGVVGNDFTVYEGTQMSSAMAYSAVKGGIINLGRYLASYFGEYNVRVNTICPGGIFDNQNEIFVKNYSKKTPLKRMGNKEEIASAVLFLASDAASYITGISLMVDGGWTAV